MGSIAPPSTLSHCVRVANITFLFTSKDLTMKRLFSFSVVCFAMAIAPFAQGQTTAVIHDNFETNEGNGGGESTALGRFANTVFTVYNESVVNAAGISAGDTLTGLSFRVDGTRDSPNFTVSDYVIRLGHSSNSAGSLDDIFANNGTLSTVRSGALDFVAADYDSATSTTINDISTIANAFGPEIEFDDDFVYAGGDLLLLYTHTGAQSLNGETVVTSRADSITNTFLPTGDVEFSEPGVQTIFGSGFDVEDRGFGATGSGTGVAPIVQFSVTTAVPEPSSAALLMGIGMIGALRRRRK